MAHDQGGAEGATTKQALKTACMERPNLVYLYSTSAFGNGSYEGPASELPEGMTFCVVGPDPYKSRKWYATVERVGARVKVK